jgi:ATP-binding cassette subfamily G (WHITE) protein 2 (SNQ2)
LLFSARLRQSYNTPEEEKVRYVYSIMDLLELTPLQHALVGSMLPSLLFDLTPIANSF